MKKCFSLVMLFIAYAFIVKAQHPLYIIRLKDKGENGFSLAQPSAFLSQKSIQRRIKQHITLNETDLPVSKKYTDSLAKISGVRMINASKWLNQVLVEISEPEALDKINQCSFVTADNMVSIKPRPRMIRVNHPLQEEDIQPTQYPTVNSAHLRLGSQADVIDYGNNYPQVHIHEGEFLHNLGFRGEGITIAMLDAGYQNYKTNPAYDSIRANNQILGEYDFVLNETSVNEDNSHGSHCLSMMAANRPGIMVGTAPKASFWLFKTEDVATETPAEEQYWVVAAERADSAGVDIISSSLGYTNFDNPEYNHAYEDRDGNTALITIGADLAAQKGMIVMNAAGNSGAAANDTKYVMCPADGDSVTTVGAVNASGEIAPFSCWGPTGKTKPNIVSVGWNAVFLNTAGNLSTTNGTSLANPNVAGLIACLWQAFGDFTNMEIIDAVQKSAHQYDNPDNRFGYGIPNFRLAYQILQSKREERYNQLLKRSWLNAYPVPFKQTFTVFMKAPKTGKADLRLIDMMGRILYTKSVSVVSNNYYSIPVTPPILGRGIYYLHYSDGTNKTTLQLISN